MAPKPCTNHFQFLDFTKTQGNDLSTPRGRFPGLVPGLSFKRSWHLKHIKLKKRYHGITNTLLKRFCEKNPMLGLGFNFTLTPVFLLWCYLAYRGSAYLTWIGSLSMPLYKLKAQATTSVNKLMCFGGLYNDYVHSFALYFTRLGRPLLLLKVKFKAAI